MPSLSTFASEIRNIFAFLIAIEASVNSDAATHIRLSASLQVVVHLTVTFHCYSRKLNRSICVTNLFTNAPKSNLPQITEAKWPQGLALPVWKELLGFLKYFKVLSSLAEVDDEQVDEVKSCISGCLENLGNLKVLSPLAIRVLKGNPGEPNSTGIHIDIGASSQSKADLFA